MFSKTARFIPSILTIPILLGLVACGGDEATPYARQSVPSTPILIDTSNQSQIESDAILNMGIASGLGGSYSGGLSSDSSQTDVLNYVNGKIATVFGIANGSDTRGIELSGLVQAAASQTFACDVSGSITISFDIANATADQNTVPTYTAGDTLSLSFANCNDGFGVTNGSIGMTVHGVDTAGVPNDISISFGPLTETYTDGIGNSTIHGSIRVANVTSNGTTTVTIATGTEGLYFDYGGTDVVTFYMDITAVATLTTETLNGTFRLDSTELNGRLDITFNNVSGPVGGTPTSGSIVVVGSNATLTITFNATGYTATLVNNPA